MPVRKLNKYFDFEYEKLETYFEEMAKKGFKFIDMNDYYTTFEKTYPKNCKYKVIPNKMYFEKSYRDIDENFSLENYECYTTNNFLVYCTEKNNNSFNIDEKLINKAKKEQ